MIQQMLKSDGWKEVEKIIEEAKDDYLNANKETVEEKRLVYQTLNDLKQRLINLIA